MTLRAEEIVAVLDLDLSYEPAGTTGYGDLERNAVIYEIAGRKVAVASLDDIIRSKEAANREKDRSPHATASRPDAA